MTQQYLTLKLFKSGRYNMDTPRVNGSILQPSSVHNEPPIVLQSFPRARAQHRAAPSTQLPPPNASIKPSPAQYLNVLHGMLDEVLIEQGHHKSRDLVDHMYSLAQSARKTHQYTALQAALTDLELEDSVLLIRAFSLYFRLENLIEQLHPDHHARAYATANSLKQPKNIFVLFAHCKRHGIDDQVMQAALKKLSLVPVLTAHPTESMPHILLLNTQRIASDLLYCLNNNQLPNANIQIAHRIQQNLTAAWQTDELATQPPSVADEVNERVLANLKNMYAVVPRVYRDITQAYANTYWPYDLLQEPVQWLKFGSWVGGDMDGNPNVTAQTIRDTLTSHRAALIQYYLSDICELENILTQCLKSAEFDGALLDKINSYQQQFTSLSILPRFKDMPYKQMMFWIKHRLEAVQDAYDNLCAYTTASQLHSDLTLIFNSLIHHKGRNAGALLVQDLMLRVQVFGLHFASLDVRQDSQVHRRAASQLLQRDDFMALDSRDRVLLLQQYMTHRSFADVQGSELKQVIDVLKSIQTCRSVFGDHAVGPYIISMAQGLDDVLALLLLAKVAKVVDAQDNVVLDIEPLFETVLDLQHAPSILEAMLTDMQYSQHLKTRGNIQHVMLGYSDSSKVSGVVASRWALQKAQRAMFNVAQQYGIELKFFHGCGGTVSRGGSGPWNFIRAQPASAINHHLRLTEQGEVIHARYGSEGMAQKNLEKMLGAVLKTSLSYSETDVPPQYIEVLELFAQQSEAWFKALVYENPKFHAYFEKATLINEIKHLKIGSRPASRRAQQGIEDLRAIPWVASWIQNRHILTGWYGTGFGLACVIERYGIGILEEMRDTWPFFANLLVDTENTLAKTDLEIGEYYADLAGDLGHDIFDQIEEEFGRTEFYLKKILGIDALLEKDPVLQKEISDRNAYLAPMNLLQINLLKHARQGSAPDEDVMGAIKSSILCTAHAIKHFG